MANYQMDYWDAYYRGQTVHTGASHYHVDPWGYAPGAGTGLAVANNLSASVSTGPAGADQQVSQYRKTQL